VTTIPTPVSFTSATCANMGYAMALQHAPKNWRIVALSCEDGREV
jgi:hypothetical protein